MSTKVLCVPGSCQAVGCAAKYYCAAKRPVAIWSSLNTGDIIRGELERQRREMISLESQVRLEREIVEVRSMLVQAIQHNDKLLALRQESHKRLLQKENELAVQRDRIIGLENLLISREAEINRLRLQIKKLKRSPKRTVSQGGNPAVRSMWFLPTEIILSQGSPDLPHSLSFEGHELKSRAEAAIDSTDF
jgi:hypothetical protein